MVFRRWLAVAALALFSLSAAAEKLRQPEVEWAQQAADRALAKARSGSAPGGRSYANTSGGPTVEIKKPLPWTPNRTQVNEIAKWKALATPNNLAKSIISPSTAVGIVVGGALSYAMAQACIRVFNGVMEVAPGGAWEQCKFITTDAPIYRTGGSAGTDAATPQASCQLWATAVYGWAGAQGQLLNWPTSSSCRAMANGSSLGSSSTLLNRMETQTVQDPNEPWIPVTPAQAETKLTEAIEDKCDSGVYLGCGKLLEEIMEQGAEVEVSQLPLTGPSSLSGGSSTKTGSNPDGTTTTMTVTNTYNFTYTDQSVKVTTTVTTNKDGETTTETTEEDTRTECEKTPDAPLCNLTVPQSDPMPQRTVTVGYEAQNLGFGSGQCPPPTTFTVKTGTYAIEWTGYCNALTTFVKPILLAFALLAAYFIILPREV